MFLKLPERKNPRCEWVKVEIDWELPWEIYSSLSRKITFSSHLDRKCKFPPLRVDSYFLSLPPLLCNILFIFDFILFIHLFILFWSLKRDSFQYKLMHKNITNLEKYPLVKESSNHFCLNYSFYPVLL